jgi:hypothetical protein
MSEHADEDIYLPRMHGLHRCPNHTDKYIFVFISVCINIRAIRASVAVNLSSSACINIRVIRGH